jgi:hypothetical protein
MTTRRITDSSIGAGGGGAVVRFQDDEPIAIRPGELWVESDGTSSLINANDYLTKVDASAAYATKAEAGGLRGGGTDKVFFENDQIVTTNYTITTNKNALSAGPIEIDSGVEVEIPANSVWTIV